MLVLYRRVGETFIIGNDIEVTILRIEGRNQVRIGINASKEIPVLRKELYEKIQKERKAGIVRSMPGSKIRK